MRRAASGGLWRKRFYARARETRAIVFGRRRIFFFNQILSAVAIAHVRPRSVAVPKLFFVDDPCTEHHVCAFTRKERGNMAKPCLFQKLGNPLFRTAFLVQSE